MVTVHWIAGAAAIVLGWGCASQKPPETRSNLTVGGHRLNVVVPPSLEVIDLGKTVEMRSQSIWPGDAAFQRITFQDLGPLRDAKGDTLESAATAALGTSGLDSLADHALRRLDYDGRIEVERRRHFQIGGRPVVALDTWYRSTHQRYRRVAIVLNGRGLLVVEAQQGPWEVVGKHFEDVLITAVFDT
jgi:hypothetical protein